MASVKLQFNEKKENIPVLENYIKKANDVIGKANYQRKEIQKQRLDAELKKAAEIYQTMNQASLEELKQELREANISEQIIEVFVTEKHKENKKWLFNIFKK